MSYVYLIGPRDWQHGVVKIGVTRSHPVHRLKSFQTGSPVELQLYGYFPGDQIVERLFHAAFRPMHKHGEWFALDGKLLAFVSDIYGDTFGERAWSLDELDRCICDLLLSEEPPHPTYSSVEEWVDSADTGILSEWVADRCIADMAKGQIH